jgi:hypothetical protein
MRGRRCASANCRADADSDCGGPYTIPVTVIPVTAATIRVTAAAVPATSITGAAAAVSAATITGAAAAVPATGAAATGAAATGAAATVNHICEGIMKSPNARGAEHLYRLTLRRSVKECAARHQHCRH